jgi:hypothetical protein
MVEAYSKFIGGRAQLQIERGLTVPVEIKDVRSSFGRIDAKVWPVGGLGSSWVNFSRLDMVAEPVK